MFKKTKYASKGGTLRRAGGGKTKYRSKGGTIRRKSGGRTK